MAMRRVKIRRKVEVDVTYAVEEAIRAKVEAEVDEDVKSLMNAYQALSDANDKLLEEKAELKRELVKVTLERDDLRVRVGLDDIPF